MTISRQVLPRLGVAVLVLLVLGLLTARLTSAAPPTDTQASGVIIYAISGTNRLISFDSAAPSTLLSNAAITGLQAGEGIIGIDFRPATAELFALTSMSRMLTINPQTAAATQVGTTPFVPPADGTAFGMDFNPTVDRIRLTSNSEQNLRLNPNTGAVAFEDVDLAYAVGDLNQGADPNIAGSAYTSNYNGATSTSLYNIDSVLNVLVTQTPPNTGTLNTVGSLGVDVAQNLGFDISAAGAAYFVTDPGTGADLYTIDLNSGTATLVGAVGDGTLFIDSIAIAPPPALIYAVDSSNNLHSFYSNEPSALLGTNAITGLQSGENVVGIDFRPKTGELYALGSTSRVYKLDTTSAVATMVGTDPFTTTLNGTAFGFDFNPTVDRIRITSNADQNLRAHPDTGKLAAVDSTLTYAVTDTNSGANPNVVGSAYINNYPGATTTTLYNLDSNLDIVVTQAPPNNGTLNTVGPLGIDIGEATGFDVEAGLGPSQYAFASAEVGGTTNLYAINLTSGAAISAGPIANGTTDIVDIAIVAPDINAYLLGTGTASLYAINTANPAYLLGLVNVTGLQADETLLGIDFRPATGALYALGSTNRLYTINVITGEAFAVTTNPLTTTVTGPGIGFDFNPTVDRLRINTSTGQNLRVNPDTGVVIVDTSLAYAAGDPNEGETPMVAGAAYTNNYTGTSSTMLYDLDYGLDVLVTQNPANNGTLQTVGSLGVAIDENTGFDVDDLEPQVAIASINEVQPQLTSVVWGDRPAGTNTALYSINLATGSASFLGALGAPVSDVALYLFRPDATAVTVGNIAATPASTGFPMMGITVGVVVTGLVIAGLRRRSR